MANKDGKWVTIKGRKVFIQEGETPSEAINRSKKTNKAQELKKKREWIKKYGNKTKKQVEDEKKKAAELKRVEKIQKQAIRDFEKKHGKGAIERMEKEEQKIHDRVIGLNNKKGKKKR